MSSASVLVVDDDATLRMLAKEVFCEAGYRVQTAESGESALETLTNFNADIVLLDIMMPGIDGHETCQLIKALPNHRHTPVIMLTGLDDVEAVERSYDAGAWDFTTKPINWPMLIHRVEHAIRAARAFASERTAAQLSRAIDNSPSEVLALNANTFRIQNANASALKNLGYTAVELQSLSITELTTDSHVRKLREELATLSERQQIKICIDLKRKDGTLYPAEGTLLRTPEDPEPVCIALLQDISERRRAEEELHRLAFYDELTGLPNRRLLQEHVETALSLAHRNGTRCALCILDLDGFKLVNDSLGHSVGDMLLQEVSQRLDGLVRDHDLIVRESLKHMETAGAQVARLGGDEFLIMLTDLKDATVPARVAARALAQLSQPFFLDGNELNLTGSIGISMYPEDAGSLDELMMHADTAMYKAKNSGKNSYAFYTQEAGDHTAARLTLESQLRTAIKNDELELHYQPQVSNCLGRIVGAEALLRWRKPGEAMRYPNQFISLAEECGLIIPIGEWVLRHAFARLERWHDQVPSMFKMAVNVSGHQLREHGFLDLMQNLLREYPLARENLVIELTESSLMSSAESSIRWLHKLKDTGVEIAIDDFGTGYSSLSYLQKFPIDYLKVDRSFVTGVDHNPEGAAIVTAIFRMAQAMNINLTVEGVETHAELTTLRAIGDSLIQGWLVSEALPEKEFLDFTAAYPTISPDVPRIRPLASATH